MRKKFLSNLGLVIFLNLLVKPLYLLGIDAEVQKQVGEEEYGIYFALFNLSMLLNIFMDFGITNFNIKNIAQHKQLLDKHLSGILVLRSVLSVFYMVLILVVGFVLGYRGQILWILIILGFNQVLASLLLYLRSNLIGLHLFKQDGIVSVLDRLILIVLCGALLWGGFTDTKFKIEWFVVLQTFAYLVTIMVTFFLVYKNVVRVRVRWNTPFSLMLLKKGIPYALLVLLMQLYYRTDNVMLERMLPNGAQEAGLYAKGFRYFEAANMVAYLFGALLLPIFSKMIKQGEKVEELVLFSFKILFAIVMIVAFASMIFSYEIMEILYNINIEQAAGIFRILMFCFVGYSMNYVFGALLTANGNMKAMNIMAAIGVFINIILNIILIPKYAAYGSAVASLITQTFTAVVQVWLCVSIFKLKVNYRLMLMLPLFVIGLFGLIYLMQFIDYPWVYKLGLFTFLGIMLAWATSFLNFREFLTIVRKE